MSKTQRTTNVTFAGTAITSVLDASVTEQTNGSEVLHTDASDAAQAVFVDGLHAVISVASSDVSQRSGLAIGASGVLVVTRKDRANGRGDTATTVVETYAEAVYTGCSDSAGTAGSATVTFSFTAVSSAGTAAGIVAYS